MARALDPCFEDGEHLYRRVDVKAVRRRTPRRLDVRPSAVTLDKCETSVFREKFLRDASLDEVVQGGGAKNGVVSITAGQLPIAVTTSTGDRYVWSVADRPSKKNRAHAGIQISPEDAEWDPSFPIRSMLEPEDQSRLKKALSDRMVVEQYPRDPGDEQPNGGPSEAGPEASAGSDPPASQSSPAHGDDGPGTSSTTEEQRPPKLPRENANASSERKRRGGARRKKRH